MKSQFLLWRWDRSLLRNVHAVVACMCHRATQVAVDADFVNCGGWSGLKVEVQTFSDIEFPPQGQMDAVRRTWLFMTFHALKINYYWITKIYRSNKVLTAQFQRFIPSSQAVKSWWVFLGLPSVWKEKHRPRNTIYNDLLTVNADRLEFPSYQHFVF